MIKKYAADFRQFGILRFETGVISGRGQPEQFALLNEDQCYLLLTYSRNSAMVRALNINLVKAFREARDNASVTDAQYLPFYHAMHDEVAALAQRAKDKGSDTPERIPGQFVRWVVSVRTSRMGRLFRPLQAHLEW